MRIKIFRRILCVMLSVLMVAPLLLITPQEANAASKLLDITIVNVTRRYRDSAAFLKLCNDYRASKNYSAWEMDTELYELAMKKAAEIAVYTDENNLDGTNFLSSKNENRGLMIGYGVTSGAVLLESFKSDSQYAGYLLSSTYKSAGIGSVEVDGIKYVCVLLSDKTPNPVDDDVLTQINQRTSEQTKCYSGYLSDCTLNYSNDSQIVCDKEFPIRLRVHNQKFDDANVYISCDQMVLSSSDTSVFRPTGNGNLIGVNPGTAIITAQITGVPEINISVRMKAMPQTFADCKIAKIPDQIYSGSALTPGVTITKSTGVALVAGKDYTLAYSNNIEVGTAEVRITGIGSYAGASTTEKFNIVNNPNAFSVTLKSNEPAIEVGQSATLIAAFANGKEPVKYKFESAPQGSSTFGTVRSESTDSTCTFKPSSAGTYNLRVTATDADKKVATANMLFSVSTPISINLTLNSTNLTLGNKLTITTSATGGSSPYKYAYYVLEPGSTAYKAIASFGDLKSLNYEPTVVGTYQIRCDVKGSNDVVATVSKSFVVSSNTTPANPLVNNSTVSATSVTAGTTVTLTGKASGGTSPYNYAYYYKKSTDSTWTTIAAYSTATSKTFKPTAAGTYTARVYVKDNDGTLVSKDFTVTVKAAALVNNSTVSATSVNVNTTVTLTGKASGGTTPYNYAYYYKKSTESSWTTIASYSTATSKTFKPTAAGTYTARVYVKDNDGTLVSKDFTVTVKAAALVNNSTVSATSVNVNTTVTLTGKASGGTSPYNYAYYYKKSTDSTWTTIAAYSTATSKTFKPTTAGTYTARVNVKDNNGTVVSKDFTVTVKAPALVNSSTISATSVNVNTTVTLTGKASGGTTPYNYAYYYKKSTDSSWTKIAAYSTSTSKTFKPTAAGTYNARVNVKDNNGTVVSKDFTVTVKAPALVNSSTISATSVNVNTTVTLTGKASGGTTPYNYAYYYKKSTDSSWTKIAAYSTSTSKTFKPTAAGTYTARVNVKDNNGTVVSKDFTVTVKAPALVNSSTISATSVNVNTTVTLTGKASGGTTPYNYAYYYKKSTDSSWTKIAAYSTSTSKTFKPTAAGTYTARVNVNDNNGTVVSKDFTATVKAPTLVNSSTISSTSVNVNSTVTLTGKASGGTSPYKYAYYYKKSTDSSWTKIAAYSTSTSKTFKPTAAGTYTARVNVKDNNGTVVSKDFTATVKAPALVNSSTISATSVNVNTTVTLTGKASGGTTPYNYAYYYKKSTDSSWTKIAAYSTSTSKTFKPTAAGTYNARVNVKDNNGTVVSKDFTVTVKAPTLVNSSTISSTSVNVNSTVTLTGKASGGTSPYKYAYYYKKSTASTWTKAYVTSSGSAYTKYDSVTFKPTSAGTYNVKINVKDQYGEGDMVSKEFTLTVKAAALVNSSTISATSVKVNTTVTLTGKASGGTSPYKYAYYYKKSTASTWTKAYVTSSGSAYTKYDSVTFKPTSAGTYNVKINVKDQYGEGDVVSKEFTLTVK